MVPSNLSTRSSDEYGDDLSSYLGKEKFTKMEEVDETENISAFLARMTALKEGGHFDRTKKPGNSAAEQPVEVDAEIGFVDRSLEPTVEDDDEAGAWWSGERLNNMATEDPRSNAMNLNDTQEEVQLPAVSSAASSTSTSIVSSRGRRGRRSRRQSSRGRDDWSVASKSDDDSSSVLSRRRQAATSGRKRTSPLASPSQGLVRANNSFSRLQLTPNSSMRSHAFGFEKFFDSEVYNRRMEAAKWNSPWERRWRIDSSKRRNPANLLLDIDFPPISGVAAAAKLTQWAPRNVKRRMPVRHHWNTTYKERTMRHEGYFDVDVFSIYDTSIVLDEPDELDYDPWEERDVYQRFLYEKSISFSRNWFGSFVKTKTNQKLRQPVALPKSMEMPMDNLPHAGEWVEEWYTTWQTRQLPPGDDDTRSSHSWASDTYATRSTFRDDTTAYTRDTYGDSTYVTHSDDESTWDEEPPECGTFKNVKLKIGERLSRVHPDYTSSLRRSRWRKKYFPRGTFPYK